MSKVIIVSGSPSKSSRLNGILHYAEEFLRENGNDVEILNVIDIPAEDLIFARFTSEAILTAIKQIEEADAVIVASQVYKASFTGVLKTFLDLLPQKGLEDKVVLPLVLGGTLAHFLTIDYSFKPVLATLGSKRVLNGVYSLDSNVQYNINGIIEFEDQTQERINQALVELIKEIQINF
ncbi:NADPH-dependent FMN reductase [Halalkalibacter alkalisediminis]|uniref:NADPH-dependent FMN reductase n=1 Tax=Halalkalibacter alkalisediminis TaxID=935616 RepID=A0ABV6NDQ3_9BACI|nr:NADPH-dependent FMN reductase [Halalkalibacter alkalisediminis]